MSKALETLLASNRLEQLDDNLFLGRAGWGPGSRLFGGEVMCQSLSAAQKTVTEGQVLHSMHAYFMRPGDPARPVIYDVENIRDGKSFFSRRVTARQHGHAIYSCQCSFQLVEPGYDHQQPMPQVAGPENLITDEEMLNDLPPDTPRPESWPIEYRQVNPVGLKFSPAEAVHQVWMKANGTLPDELSVHQQMLAFASDNHLLAVALRPHGVSIYGDGIQAATIDHSLWFHRPFRMDDWLLYSMNSPSASNARGLNLGQIYDRQGNLVASSAQEGLIRQR